MDFSICVLKVGFLNIVTYTHIICRTLSYTNMRFAAITYMSISAAIDILTPGTGLETVQRAL